MTTNFYKKARFFLYSTMSLFFLFSCTFGNEPSVNYVKASIKDITPKNIANEQIGAKVSISLKKIEDSFETKSTNGQLAKAFSDVKSYDVFLSTNLNDPFATGSNPLGDNMVVRVDSTANSSQTLTINNVPAGGPYYAFVAAFDGVSSNVNRANITEVDPSITSIDKRWAKSNNTVVVNTDFTLIFSDNSNAMNVSSLQLQNEVDAVIDSTITVFDAPVPSINAF